MRTYREVMTAYGLLAENFLGRGRKDLYNMVLCVTFAMMHVHTLFDPAFREDTDAARNARLAICDYIGKFLVPYLEIPEEERKQQYVAEAAFLNVRKPEKYYRNLLSWAGQVVGAQGR